MKKFKVLVSAALLALSLNNQAHAWGNFVSEPFDKALHFGVSAGVSYAGYYACKEITDWKDTTCRIASGIATFAVTGVGKEYSDVNWDNRDLAASAGGTALGIGLTFSF